jgi:hypothetical protein
MTGNTRILNPGPEALFYKNVAVTNSGRLNRDANLIRAWLRNLALH